MIFADALDWTSLADRYGVLGVVSALFVVALFRKWIVMGYQLRDAEKREADWKRMAVSGTLIAERATGRDKWTVQQRLQFLEDQIEQRGSGE